MKKYSKLTMWIGTKIWCFSERHGIKLGRFAPVVFGWMMGVKGEPVQDGETQTNPQNTPPNRP